MFLLLRYVYKPTERLEKMYNLRFLTFVFELCYKV